MLREGRQYLAAGERVTDAAATAARRGTTAQPPYTSPPTPSGPAASTGCSVTARTYMNAQTGRMPSATIAQNGIRRRDL